MAPLAKVVVASLLLAAAGPAAASTIGGSVTLGLGAGSSDAPSYRACAVAIPLRASVADVLDLAARDACIESWTYEGGRVRCVDGLCSDAGWAIHLDERLDARSPWRIAVLDGQQVELVLANARPDLNLA